MDVTVVDVNSGELSTFGADDGIELAQGVAASAAAAGAVRPIPVGGRAYMTSRPTTRPGESR